MADGEMVSQGPLEPLFQVRILVRQLNRENESGIPSLRAINPNAQLVTATTELGRRTTRKRP